MWLVGDEDEGYELSTQTASDALEPVGVIHKDGDDGPAIANDDIPEGLAQAIRVASLCNVATIQQNEAGTWVSTGDPTEVALQVFATKLGMGRPTLTPDEDEAVTIVSSHSSDEKEPPAPVNIEDDDNNGFRFQLMLEFPFSSDTKKMSTIYFDHENPGKSICYTKGAVCCYLPSI
jgi:magnesium-transporting ATPase (P-type)